MSNWARNLLFRHKWLVILISLGLFCSCSNRNGTINRVVAPYWDKAYFNPNWEQGQLSPEWYYRLTVVDTPTNTKAASIGDGHWLHPETIRWEITEKYLIGWRAHAAVPGAEGELKEGVDNYKGAPVAVFAIANHFDINRDYDNTTGEIGNVISEDTRGRSWHQRRFMRVDWSNNIVSQLKRKDAYPWLWGSTNLEKDIAYAVDQNDPANPKRYRFEDSYFEITTRQGIKVDIMSYYGNYGEPYQFDSASPVVDVRMSFMKKPASDYEPLPYPDFVNVTTKGGKNLYDDNRFSEKLPIWEKFGFYRASFSGQQTWDQKRGSVESNKNYNITRFNIWKNTYREVISKDGKKERELIPIEKREVKPIIYYTNVLHPESLMNASRKVEEQWNLAFKELVFYAQPGKYTNINDVPDMWILYENSCNVQNVSSYLKSLSPEVNQKVLNAAKQDMEEIKKDIQTANDPKNEGSFTDRQSKESQAKSNLEKICTALEYFTQGTQKPFTYEREGDLRYNLLNLITKRAATPWSGLGPMFADSLTGEIIQSTANVNLWYIDKRAAQASDQIDLMLGNIKLHELVFGTDVQKYINSKMAYIKAEAAQLPSSSALKKMERHFAALEQSNSLLRTISPLSMEKRMALIAHTPMEKKLFHVKGDDKNDEILLLQNRIPPGLGQEKLELSDEIMSRLSPARGADIAKQVMRRSEEIAKMAHSFADPPEFLDHLITGIALQYKDLSRKERFEKIREAVYTAVALHEVGHNVGLTHNMSGSSDALNYGKQFWNIESLPKTLSEALVATNDSNLQKLISDCKDNEDLVKTAVKESGLNYELTTQDCLRQAEVMYSSIMDYHAAWNSDLGGLGPYDVAAIKFGYAQLAEVYPKRNLKIDLNSQNLSRWLFLNDWRKIPNELFKDASKIHEREHIKYTWNKITSSFKVPPNEVPYRFCLDSSGAYGSTCKAFDFGPDMRSRAERNNTLYWQHYFLTHFSRDKLWNASVDVSAIVQKDLSIMADYNNMMQWYYFYRATDKEFAGSDAEKDYLAATIMGLNHYVRVLGHPAPGEHASMPASFVESLENSTVNTDRLQVSTVLVPFGKIDNCVRLNVVDTFLGIPIAPKEGYYFTNVPLGEGRPFHMGLNKDYEEWHVNYVGSLLTKLNAGYFLAYPGAWFPRTDQLTDPRFYNISWYRLFPKEVGKIFYDLIMENYLSLGPVVDVEGNLKMRVALDPVTLEAPNYEGMGQVLPTMSSLMPYRSMFYAASLLSGNVGSELDIIKTMRVSLKGSEDDLDIYNKLDKKDVATFVHPTMGYVYRALRVGENPIAYEMVEKLNIIKEKFTRLEQCIHSESIRVSDSYCHCVQTSVPKPEGGSACCHPENPDCPQITLQHVGKGNCSMRDLERRRDLAKEEMEGLVSFLDDMRWFVKKYSDLP